MAKDVNKTPTVSVVVPVYNGAAFIVECLESVIHQTYRDFELIVIDDGSTDETANIVRAFNDSRIRFIQNSTNLGLIATLNKAFELSRGKYIARLDADDIALPERFAIQVQHMELNQNLAMLGTAYFPLKQGIASAVTLATGKGKIQANMLFNSCFAHPSVIIRKAALTGRESAFNPAYPHAEDYELWSWLMRNHEVENIAEPLIYYRIHENQISKRKQDEQRATAQKIRTELLQWLDVPFSENDFLFHQQLAENTIDWTANTYERAIAHIHIILLAAQKNASIESKSFNHYLLAFISDKAKYLKLEGYKILRESSLFKQIPFAMRWECFFKCWLPK